MLLSGSAPPSGAGLYAADQALPETRELFTKRLSPPGEAPVELRLTQVRRRLNDAERQKLTDEYRHAEKVNAGRGQPLPNLERWLNEIVVRDVRAELTIDGAKKLLPPLERFELGILGERPNQVFDAARIGGRVLVLEYDEGDRLVIYGDPDVPGSKPPRIVYLGHEKTPHYGYSRGMIEPPADGAAVKIRFFVRGPARDEEQPALEADVDLVDEQKPAAIKVLPIKAYVSDDN
jgi:hypothetical protein